MAEPGSFVLHAVGDLKVTGKGPTTLGPDAMFDVVRPLLADCDLLFGGEGPWPADCRTALEHSCDRTCAVGSLRRAGFHILSCANNHIFDKGREGLLATLQVLAEHGIATCGAGGTTADAWRATVLEAAGRRAGFLAFTSYGPKNTDLRPKETAHLHADTAYEQVEPWQPGSPPEIWTRVWPGDLVALNQVVRELRQQVDLVFVSFHWGVHELPYLILDYMRDLAHTAIDAGADAVLGHHQHILQGIEFYRDRPVFYGLNELFFDTHPYGTETVPVDVRYGTRYGDYTHRKYPGWHATVHPLSRMRIIARMEYPRHGPVAISIVPMEMDAPYARPIAHMPESDTGKRVIEFLNRNNEFFGIPARVQASGTGPYAPVLPSG